MDGTRPRLKAIDRRRGALFAFGGMLAISTDSLFTRFAKADAFDIAFWVGLLSALVLLTVVRAREGLRPARAVRRDGWPVGAAALLQALSTTCFLLAVKNTTVANVVVIIAAAPLMAAGVAWFWIREATQPRTWAAIGVTAVGVVIVVSGSLGGGSLDGDLFAVGAIASFACSTVLLRQHPEISRFLVVGLGGIAMAVIAVVPATLTGYPATTWLAIIAMGAVFGPLARVLLATAPRFMPAAEVALFAPVETVFGSLWAYLAFSETPPTQTWIGGAVILTGVIWGAWPRSAEVRAI